MANYWKTISNTVRNAAGATETKQVNKSAVTTALNTVASAASSVPAIVAKAVAEKGVVRGSARHKEYCKVLGLSTSAAWCACFVCWCAKQVGVLGLNSRVPPYASCSGGGHGTANMRGWFQSKGRLYKSKTHGGSYTPKPGDLIFYNWAGKDNNVYDHVGIVVKVVSSGVIRTVEGNTSGLGHNSVVAVKDRSWNRYVVAFGSTGLYNDGWYTGVSSKTESAETVDPDTGTYYSDIGAGAYSSGAAVTVQDNTPQTVDITQVHVLSTTGTKGARKYKALRDLPGVVNQGVELLIQNDQIYQPVVEGDITLSYERKGVPGTLKFNVVKDSVLNFQEGNPVRLRVNGTNVFYGYVFTKSRSDSHVISVTAYDQLRYLKNKDTMSYSNKTYGGLLKMISKDYDLEVGEVADTKYTIPSRIEETTLFDMLGNASDLTWQNTGVLYILYDDFGRLTLKNPKDMLVPILIDADTAGEFTYSTTIDSDVYNKVKIAVDDDTTGYRNVRVYNGTENQQLWGILQYYENLDSGTEADAKLVAEQVLEYCNTKNRSLKISKAFGDLRVRGGSQVLVQLNLGDLLVQNWMNVEKVTHTFSHGEHFMDLTVTYSGVGGEFRA